MNETIKHSSQSFESHYPESSEEHTVSPIVLRARERLTGQGRLITEWFTQRQRIKRAAIVWLVLWLLAILAIAIPVVHFVLAPLLLIAGPVAAYLRYRERIMATRIEAECPLCNDDIFVSLPVKTELPHWEVCPQCHGHIQLRKTPVDTNGRPGPEL